jgi:hypothetical protein
LHIANRENHALNRPYYFVLTMNCRVNSPINIFRTKPNKINIPTKTCDRSCGLLLRVSGTDTEVLDSIRGVISSSENL